MLLKPAAGTGVVLLPGRAESQRLHGPWPYLVNLFSLTLAHRSSKFREEPQHPPVHSQGRLRGFLARFVEFPEARKVHVDCWPVALKFGEDLEVPLKPRSCSANRDFVR